MDLSRRADLNEFPELMDQPCSFETLRGCLRSIASVNRLTRASAPTLHWLNEIYPVLARQSQPVHIVDVGCGYGDMLRTILRWAEERHLALTLTGIDLNPDAIRAAREATRGGMVAFFAGDAFDFHALAGVDLVISSLLMHHLPNPEIVRLLNWMDSTARLGWFINDLHRQAIPYHFFRTMARFTSWHPFVKHDGPVSILRSFRREDWMELCQAAALTPTEYSIREYRPARLCVARLRPADNPAALAHIIETGASPRHGFD